MKNIPIDNWILGENGKFMDELSYGLGKKQVEHIRYSAKASILADSVDLFQDLGLEPIESQKDVLEGLEPRVHRIIPESNLNNEFGKVGELFRG